MRLRFFICCAALLFALAAQAQPWPAKPIKLIVPDAPGSPPDLRARQIGAKLAEGLGQPIVIENKPGGSMAIGAEVAARAAADGYTLFLGNIVTHSLNPLMVKSLTYRPDDLIPVTLVSAGPLILVVNPAKVPAKTLEEFITHAKANPGKLNYGVLGQGSVGHVLMEQLKSQSSAKLEYISYKGSSQFTQDLIAGHLDIALNYWSIIGPHVRSGKLRALAVAAPRRLEVAPDIPTFAEAGMPGIEALGWQGLMVPRGTPRAIVQRLYVETAKALNTPEIRTQLIETGAEVGGNTPEEFASFMRADFERWKKAVAESRLEPQ